MREQEKIFLIFSGLDVTCPMSDVCTFYTTLVHSRRHSKSDSTNSGYTVSKDKDPRLVGILINEAASAVGKFGRKEKVSGSFGPRRAHTGTSFYTRS